MFLCCHFCRDPAPDPDLATALAPAAALAPALAEPPKSTWVLKGGADFRRISRKVFFYDSRGVQSKEQ